MKKFFLIILIFVTGESLIATSLHASVITRENLFQSTQGSALIFEGLVLSKREQLSSTGQPFTYFTFKVLDVIKGTYSKSSIELGYLGGIMANGLRMEVADMHMPLIGEHGIYFVESLTRQQVHPLFGWQQGHYLVTSPQPGIPARVVPFNHSTNSSTAAPSLSQFKQLLRSLMRNGL